MLAFMHQGTPYGHLTLPATKEGGKDILRPILPAILARMVGCSEEEVQHFLKELEGAGVFSRTDESVIFSRRMVQDEKLRESRAADGIESLNNPHVPRPRGPSKDRPKDQRKDTLPGSPSSSSSSSSARHKNTASENFNATEIAQILCQRNGWSGQGMIWALQEAIDFKATEMPEATLEQVGEWLVTGGIRCGELWTIGALPGKGKTALGVQVALANGSAGIPTYAFSLEMQDLEIGKRFLAAKSSVAAGQIRNPQTIREDRWSDLRRAAADISECPIYVDVRGSIKIQELLASARLYIRRHGVKLIVVDYLRLVDAPGRDLRDRVSYVANALRQLAKTDRIGVVLLSQLRRPEGGVNSRPSMLDLKESGDIEAHSHVVLLPYLPVGDDGKQIPDEQLLIIGKNRNGGVGSLPVYFDERRLQFFDRQALPKTYSTREPQS